MWITFFLLFYLPHIFTAFVYCLRCTHMRLSLCILSSRKIVETVWPPLVYSIAYSIAILHILAKVYTYTARQWCGFSSEYVISKLNTSRHTLERVCCHHLIFTFAEAIEWMNVWIVSWKIAEPLVPLSSPLSHSDKHASERLNKRNQQVTDQIELLSSSS